MAAVVVVFGGTDGPMNDVVVTLGLVFGINFSNSGFCIFFNTFVGFNNLTLLVGVSMTLPGRVLLLDNFFLILLNTSVPSSLLAFGS